MVKQDVPSLQNDEFGFRVGEDILLAMLTLGFDSYVEPLRTFLTKIRDASKYDRTITMGGELTDELRLQVSQAQPTPAVASMAQAQVATQIQVQPQAQPTAGPTINPKATGNNGLEPYGHSVRRRSLFTVRRSTVVV